MTKKTAPIEHLAYETALAELEEIVAALEDGACDLQDALRLFERGQLLARHCSSLLDHAELRIQQLTGDTLSPFEPAE